MSFTGNCILNIYWHNRDERLRDSSNRSHLHIYFKLSKQHTRHWQNSSEISCPVHFNFLHKLFGLVRLCSWFFLVMYLLIDYKNDDFNRCIPEYFEINQVYSSWDS